MSDKEKGPQSPSSNKKQPLEDLNLSAVDETLSEVKRSEMSEIHSMELQDNEEKSKELMCSPSKSESTPHVSTNDPLTMHTSPNKSSKVSEPEMDRTEEMPIETLDVEKSTSVPGPDNTISEVKSLETIEDPPLEFQDNYFGNEEKLEELMCSPSKKSKLTLPTSTSDTLKPSTVTRSPNSESKLSETSMDITGQRPIIDEALNVENPIRIISSPGSSKQPLVQAPEECIQSLGEPSGEVQMDGTGRVSSEQASMLNTGGHNISASGVDQSHVCTETCIHGGARPKTRSPIAAKSVNQSSNMRGKRSRHWEKVESFAERMENNLSVTRNSFGKVMHMDLTGNLEYTRNISEGLADRMGHSPFIQASSNSEFPPYLSSLTQVNRMFTNLNLDAISEQETRSQCQEPNPLQVQSEERKIHQETTIHLNQVPEPRRTIDVDEVLATALQKWQISYVEDAEYNEEREAIFPQVEEPAQNRDFILIPLPQRELGIGNDLNNPNNIYLIEEDHVWRAVMLGAYETESYHNQEMLEQAMSHLEREGISEEDFFRHYHTARKMFLFRDEGVGDETTVERRIEERIIQLIVAFSYMVVGMLYMRMYVDRYPDFNGMTTDSSTRSSGKFVKLEWSPNIDYGPLREHVHIEPESSEDTNSPKEDSSPQEIQILDFSSSPDRGSPVNILLPLDQVPIKRADTPSSQNSLLNEGAPSRSSREMMRKAVLVKNQSRSLDNTSNDASPILHDGDTCQEDELTFGQLFNLLIQTVFVVAIDLKSVEEEIAAGHRSEENQDATARTPDSTKSIRSSGTQESSNSLPIEMGDSYKSSSSGCFLEDQGISESSSRTTDEGSRNQGLHKDMEDFGATGGCELQGAIVKRMNEPPSTVEVDGPQATVAEHDKAKSSSEECGHSKEKDSSGNEEKGHVENAVSGLEEDEVRKSGSISEDGESGDHLSMAGKRGARSKRKDHSDSEEEFERVVKKGHMEN